MVGKALEQHRRHAVWRVALTPHSPPARYARVGLRAQMYADTLIDHINTENAEELPAFLTMLTALLAMDDGYRERRIVSVMPKLFEVRTTHTGDLTADSEREHTLSAFGVVRC